MKTITIYGQPDCIWCTRAQQLCGTRAYAYEYVDISIDLRARAALIRRLGREDFTVPQIFIGTRHVGGFQQLAAADKEQILQQMIGGE